jgi:hypothetical protein
LDTLGAITKGQRETGGQNMFRAEDNLESAYAKKALRQFFYKLRAGQIDVCSYSKFQKMTGLTLDDAGGSMKESLPPIQQFLNRCLALTIEMQNAIFEAFGHFLDAIIDDARKAGTLDVGLETLRGEKFEIIERRMIYQDPETGSETTALTIERTDRNHPLSLEKVRQFTLRSEKANLYWNKQSKRSAVMVQAPAFIDEDGAPILRIELKRPMTSELLEMSEFLKSNWEECSDSQFETLWQEEVGSIPEFSTSRITLISGLLLPIWDRLPTDNMKIYRLETQAGERAIGRLVTQQQLISVYQKLGLDCDIKPSSQEAFKAVMHQRNSLRLLSGCSLRRSLVMGQARLELVGINPTSLSDLKVMGCFTEMIQWKTRVFIPVNNMKVLDRILEVDPIGHAPVDQQK